MKRILYLLLSIKYVPFIIGLNIFKDISLKEDILHYSKYFGFRYNYYFTMVYLLEKIHEFRNVYFFRNPKFSFLSYIYPGVKSLYFFINSNQVGKGLVLWHGFSTVVNAISIGDNCEIWQNVTIGKKSTKAIADKPIIGNNVKICANSVVIGPIKIGNNVTIGAGAVVTKSIPDNSIVVGNPARIIKNLE